MLRNASANPSEKARFLTECSANRIYYCSSISRSKKISNNQIGLFSGIEFNVNPELELNGFCDFIISRSTLQMIIQAPIVTLVEAKNDNIKSGFDKCIAEMVAAQIFNQNKGNDIRKIYGAITTGIAWQFLELEAQTLVLDLEEYSIKNLPQILGILTSFVS
ncbi:MULTISPECIES: hypothetical protein [unclassified Okeania]|uniref:hypothetical protein n=1 Tax=unclassified Okeania TaxID=2634635 RepID=UPI00257A43E7|nr:MULTISPECIES: hypothetical protein [unclassified Okeania]